MLIIGITGTLGAGKGTVVDYLRHQHGFQHFSVRSYLSTEIESRGLPLNRDSMVAVANELREKNSPSYIVEQLWKQAKESGKNCIIESIRTPGEATALHAKGNFCLLAVDADVDLRYERVVIRGSETDKISLDEFKANEAREMHSDDPNKQNLSVCMQMADYRLENNGSIEELNQKTEEILHVIEQKSAE